MRYQIDIPPGASLRCGTCGLANANCSGNTVMQMFARNGTIPFATFDDGAAPGCGHCSYLEFDPPATAGRRSLLTSGAIYMIDVEVFCAGAGFGCAWSFQYEFVYPPPPPVPPPGVGPPLIRCFPAELPLGDYNVSLAQQAQALLVAQLRAYAQSSLVVRPSDGVAALLWVGPENATSVISFLSSVINTSFAANVRWWDQCVQRSAIATIAITSLDQMPLSVTSPEGVAALISVVHSAVVLAEVTPFMLTQTDAMVALDVTASSGQNLLPDAAQCLTSTLSDMVALALSTNNVAVLAVIPSMLERAATSQSLQLAQAAMQRKNVTALVTTSPYIETFVQVDPRITATGATVAAVPPPWSVPTTKKIEPSSCQCGGCDYSDLRTRSISWFNLSTLAMENGSLPYVAQYFALDFDPYAAQFGFHFVIDGSAGTSLYKSTGVSRLQLVDASTLRPVTLSNLSRPIAFEMPQVSGTEAVADAQGRCGFWVSNFTVYDTTGTVTLPDPRPDGHELSFVDAPLTPDNAALALAWNITGPLLENCTLAFLDCTSPPFERLRIQWNGEWGKYPHNIIYLNPWHPLDFPAVACPDATADSNRLPGGNVSNALLTRLGGQPLLRIYYGSSCEIWKVNNRFNCTWDAVRQAFFGGGCVSGAVDERTQCLVRALVLNISLFSARTYACATHLASRRHVT